VDYDPTRLGEREFEHLSQALALAVLGAGVSVFGDGPDGGREASFEAGCASPSRASRGTATASSSLPTATGRISTLTCGDAEHTCSRRKIES